MSKKKSYIDWDKRIIVGKSGMVYNIAPEKIASRLWADYQVRGALLSYGMSLEMFLKKHLEVINHLRQGKENAQGNTSNALMVLEDMTQAIKRFNDNEYNAQIEFCSIFCKTENEPVDQNDESIVRRKYEDWSEIPQSFFLTLSQLSIPWYKEGLKALEDKSGLAKSEQQESQSN